MTEQECEGVFQQITNVLVRRQLSNVVTSVIAQIAEGKIVTDDVKMLKEDFDIGQNTLFTLSSPHRSMKQSSSTQLSTIAPYTARERLEILLDVIEQTVVTPAEIEFYLYETFLPKYSFKSILFASEDDQQPIIRVGGQDQSVQDRKHFTDQLRTAITLLRKEL